MNVLFISPNFPPQFWLFCAALKREGVRVLGIGDARWDELVTEVAGALDEYVAIPGMGDYAERRYPDIHRTVAYLISRHGRLDAIDSLNEYWLPLEAALREDFNVPGPRPAELARHRSKTGMREIFGAAGVPCTVGEPLGSVEQARAFARTHGFPLVVKPDVGVGAARTHKVEDAAQLEALAGTVGPGYLVEAFAQGRLTSYDGFAGHDGRVLFETSHVYSAGVMDIVNRGLDVYYYNRRALPPRLVELGRKVVAAFGLRNRFFHVEWFEQEDREFRALEINLRPPGGFTTDLMNYSADIDVYALWARALAGRDLSAFCYERRYHAAHAARRDSRRYRVPYAELGARLGERLVVERRIPPVLAGAMGDQMFLLRSPDEQQLLDAIHLVMDPA